MVRIKRGTVSHRKHKKLLRQVKGYRLSRHRLIKRAKEATLRAGEHAFAGRKQRKRDFRRLWILRIAEAVKQNGWSYSDFIHALRQQNVGLDRKILADLVRNEPEVFKRIVEEIK